MQRLYMGIVLALALGTTHSLSAVAFPKSPSPTASVTQKSLLAEANTTKQGQFIAVEHPTAGGVKIIEENGTRYLELDDNFQSDRGPDLKVILHASNSVGLKIQEGEYISLGALSATSGSQRYLIPEDVNLDNYNSVAIWCEQFNATFGYAELGSQVALLGAGNFVDVEHPTKGRASIIEENGTRYLELSNGFKSDRGPDLKVILHTGDTVGLNIQEGDYISLGALESFNGSQRYVIPEDLDLSQYQSVAIWCEQFNATFGYAPLQ